MSPVTWDNAGVNVGSLENSIDENLEREGGREGRREGGMKEGRKERRKEGKKERKCPLPPRRTGPEEMQHGRSRLDSGLGRECPRRQIHF
jgi:hypothetical protein